MQVTFICVWVYLLSLIQIPFKKVDRRAGDVASVYGNADLAKEELGWSASRDLKQMCEYYQTSTSYFFSNQALTLKSCHQYPLVGSYCSVYEYCQLVLALLQTDCKCILTCKCVSTFNQELGCPEQALLNEINWKGSWWSPLTNEDVFYIKKSFVFFLDAMTCHAIIICSKDLLHINVLINV